MAHYESVRLEILDAKYELAGRILESKQDLHAYIVETKQDVRSEITKLREELKEAREELSGKIDMINTSFEQHDKEIEQLKLASL